jgi:hypothetical protein
MALKQPAETVHLVVRAGLIATAFAEARYVHSEQVVRGQVTVRMKNLLNVFARGRDCDKEYGGSRRRGE